MDENRNLADKAEIPFLLPETDSKTDPSLRFGWGKFRPRCLQFLNSPKWFLAGIVIYTICQGMTLMGLTMLTLPSIEKRFSLSGKEMGIIAASNDVSALLLVVFISFYGDYANKIRWIGGGGVVVGLGVLLYSLPHFLVGTYHPTQSGPGRGFCSNGDNPFEKGRVKCNLENDSQWYYIAIFVLSQLITGAGISPFYSLLPAYLDENVHPKSLPVYLGVWSIARFLGPGLGLIVGGKLLSIYVDLKQPDGLRLTARDPRWIGAWWLGFLIIGSLILLASFLVLGFPRVLPGAKERRQKHIKEGNIKEANSLQKPSLKRLLPELKSLLTNWTFLFNTLGFTSALLFVGALSPFLPKILQLKFGLKPEETGYLLGAMIIPSMSIGIFIGSFVLRRFSLKEVCKKAALFIVIIRMGGYLIGFSFLVPGCDNINLAGLNSPYNSTIPGGHMKLIPSVQKDSLTASCNINCGCSMTRFAPVCGADQVTYFDKCHAGCTTRFPNATFGNCSCIRSQVPGGRLGTAKPGYCDRDCKNVVIFFSMITINLVIQFARIVPQKTVTLRCVPDNKRAFANGIQYITMKTLGLLPGPILFGHVVDSYCTLWQDACGEKGRCFDYDVKALSYAICVLGCGLTFVSTFFYFLSWYLYKPHQVSEKEVVNVLSQLEDTADSDIRETNI